jgi:drug/metabolite transporter (DMT)-like permease
MKNRASNLGGIALTCFCVAMFSGHDVLLKLYLQNLSAGEIMTIRNGLIALIVLVWIIAVGKGHKLIHLKDPLVLLRSFIEGASTVAFIIALLLMPLSDLRAIILSTPLMVTAGSGLFLGEKITPQGWIAVFMGFIGILIVIKPDFHNIHTYYYLCALASAIGSAARQLLIRKIKDTIPTEVIFLASTIGGSLIGALLWLNETTASGILPTLPQAHEWFILLIASIIVTIGGYAGTLALRYAKMSIVSPFNYTTIIWALLADIFIWKLWPDETSLIGSMLVIISGFYILYHERKRAVFPALKSK